MGQNQESAVPMGCNLVRHLALRVTCFCKLRQSKILNYSSVGFKSLSCYATSGVMQRAP